MINGCVNSKIPETNLIIYFPAKLTIKITESEKRQRKDGKEQPTMDANNFIASLKADDDERDVCDLRKVLIEFINILKKLPANDCGNFSLNVLRMLCRNLAQVPTWRDGVDNQALLLLSVDCIRETRVLDTADRVKTLACIYHIHRHAVRQNKNIPPALVLKLSYMPFELETKHLLQEYSKTYWNILADRLHYIERLKTKLKIIQLLPQLTEDICKVIEMYDTVPFCSNILVFLIKKLHFLYSDSNAKELSETFVEIFKTLSSKNDLKLFKKLTDKENLEVYKKLSDCLYVIVDNASKVHYKDYFLDVVVRTCISMVGHSVDVFHCLQTFYLNTFCCILSENTNATYIETVLSTMQHSFVTTEKLGYKTAMDATYPFLNQLLRLYIEYSATNCTNKPWKDHFNIQIQEKCLNLILFFMGKLKNCEQLLKCENCRIKTGLHDSLRISLLIKNFITISLSENILITNILDIFYCIVKEQYSVLAELNKLRCVNYQKFFRKLQTDVHNTAITLNKAQYFEVSIKLFNIYLKHELTSVEAEMRNITRALFNKSISELDSQLYENSLVDAFLSLIFSGQDGLNTDKYMSLVMDIKAKELKSKSTNEDEEMDTDNFQLLTVLDACKMAMKSEMYEDLELCLSKVIFSVVLKHEFDMYTKLWPSIAPVAGVWRSLLHLSKGDHEDWILVEKEESVLQVLYEVILQTPSVVRTIHSEHYTLIVDELLDQMDKISKLTPDLSVFQAALLFLGCEYDLAAASNKYGWKPSQPLQCMDPDQVPANRTIPQEHAATARAILAVRLLANLLPNIHRASKTYLKPALHIYQVFVPLLLHLARDAAGMQLAYVCCKIAGILGDDESYIRNAGIIISSSSSSSPTLDRIIMRAANCREVMKQGQTGILFLCDLAIHYSRVGAVGMSARLVQSAQSRILTAWRLTPDLNLDLAVGRLMEAQTALRQEGGLSVLSAVNGTQRHYLSISATGSTWSTRRLSSLSLRLLTSPPSIRAAVQSGRLRLWRRGRAAAAAGIAAAAAASRANLYVAVTDVCCFDDAQIKIDNRLKHFLGLQPSNETQPYYAPEKQVKEHHVVRREEIETMLESMVLRKTQTSPSVPCVSVQAFKIPDFFQHNSKCTCYACEIPVCFILACQTSGLEASVYARSNENEIARNYFDGVLKMLTIAEKKLKDVTKRYDIYEKFLVDSVTKAYERELKTAELEILMELTFFELKVKNFELADENIVRIHDVMGEIGGVDDYLTNEVMNLMTTSAQLKKVVRKREVIDLEIAFESLKLSPKKSKDFVPPKTPVTKLPHPPAAATKMIVKDDELPKKRKVIKLNLDDDSVDEKDFEKPARIRTRGANKTEFKIPNPITSKPVLEIATPRPSSSKPKIIVTQPSEENDTPKHELNKTKNHFFTPQGTPEQFFTPMTSVKTYSKKSLRHNIVKNLEQEFSTPKAIDKENAVSLPPTVDKENATDKTNIPRRSKLQKEVKKALVRATSPGKLSNEKKDVPTRSRRSRKPVNFSLDEDGK